MAALAGCSSGGSDESAAPGDAAPGALPPTSDAPPQACLSSSECPTGWTCNDFHVCMPPAPGTDGGVPPETELEAGPPTGAQRHVDVAVVALARGQEKAVALTVGFRPRAVAFDAAGARAYVITQDGVSVIDLAATTLDAPHLVPPIAVADPSISPDDLEVQIVATGD